MRDFASKLFSCTGNCPNDFIVDLLKIAFFMILTFLLWTDGRTDGRAEWETDIVSGRNAAESQVIRRNIRIFRNVFPYLHAKQPTPGLSNLSQTISFYVEPLCRTKWRFPLHCLSIFPIFIIPVNLIYFRSHCYFLPLWTCQGREQTATLMAWD